MTRWFLQFLIVLTLFISHTAFTQPRYFSKTDIIFGDRQLDTLVSMLGQQRVALIVNQTSMVGNTFLADTLRSRKVNIVKIFAPEHGIRGKEDAGANVKNSTDITGIPIVSLYGANKKPTDEQMKDVDVVVYDLQDVGVRFYTYISTMQYVMEACGEKRLTFIVLDRPDPNGFYVDGPVLDPALKSFVGLQPIPIVYGMTAGEYARMITGEQWFAYARSLKLKVIPCLNYEHNMKIDIPVMPSPNLKNMAAVYLYPSLCLFEGTSISVGRGTNMPFQLFGSPDFEGTMSYRFTPVSLPGASYPMYENRTCFGKLLATRPQDALKLCDNKIQLQWLMAAYRLSPDRRKFFTEYFDRLAGDINLRQQIENGVPESQIRAGWQKSLQAFKEIRKKYLLYKDFE